MPYTLPAAPDAPALPGGPAPAGPLMRILPNDEYDLDSLALAEQSAGIGVWTVDLTTGLARGTAQFFRILGLEPTHDTVPIERIRALRHPDDRDRVIAGFRNALEAGLDSYEIEYRIVRPDGELRWIFGRGRVVRAADGTPIRYSGVDLDITERKAAQAALTAAKEELERMNQVLEERVRERTTELEAEVRRRADAEVRLHQAQKMEAVGQLTGGIAHDFNNILQVIVGNLQIAAMLVEREETPGNTVDHRVALLDAVQTAQRAARSAAQLVQRLLAFSRLQTLDPTPLDVNALIDGMTEMIGRTLGETIEVETVLRPGVWPALADRNQLESALLNLVVNARDAMPEGGRLVVETGNADIPEPTTDQVGPGQYVVVSVSDSGCGIAPDVLPKIFDPFFTTKDTGKGSGLGLSMVYGFVKQTGGHVRIDSEVGVGTTIRLYLPRSPLEVVTNGRSPHAGASELARPGECVLVVEDNDEVRRLGVAALERLGYRVLQARDGPSALALLDRDRDARIDLLFTDVVLPSGMSGRVLADAVLARRPQLPVLFTSGYTRHGTNPGMSAADRAVLGKPYTIARLAGAVRQAIDHGIGTVSGHDD